MDRINGADTFDIGSGRRGFRDENLVAGVAGTEVTAAFLNAVQEEIMKVVTEAGLVPSASDWTQLWQALQVHGLSTVNRSRLWLAVTSMTVSTPPASPASGDTYLIPTGASGVWSANVGKIAQWTGSSWAYLTPPNGHGISLPDGRVFERINGAYVELLASETRSGLVELATSAEAAAGTDTSRAVTPAGMAAAITAAITKLVNGSPAALDTLVELATALGNDANFATTVTNALAGKVDLTRTATDTRTGIVELATPAEAIAGTDTERAVTPAGLAAGLSNITPRPNLCPNGGFEDGIDNIVVTKSGSGVWPSAISTNSWGRSLYLTGTKTDGTYLLTWPSFPVDSGITYTISGDAALLATSGTVRYQILWLDASGAVLSTGVGPSRTPSDFNDSNARRQAMALAVAAPTGAVKAQLQCVFDTVVGATAIFVRLAKVERGALPATAYTSPPPKTASYFRMTMANNTLVVPNATLTTISGFANWSSSLNTDSTLNASAGTVTIGASDAGVWVLSAAGVIPSSASTEEDIYLLRNGAAFAWDKKGYPSGGSDVLDQSVATTIRLVAGDVIKAAYYQTYASGANLLTGDMSYFAGVRIGS